MQFVCIQLHRIFSFRYKVYLQISLLNSFMVVDSVSMNIDWSRQSNGIYAIWIICIGSDSIHCCVHCSRHSEAYTDANRCVPVNFGWSLLVSMSSNSVHLPYMIMKLCVQLDLTSGMPQAIWNSIHTKLFHSSHACLCLYV